MASDTNSGQAREAPAGKLLSIHLTSNRPRQFSQFLDHLQEKTVDMNAVEVVVKIDRDDAVMNELLRFEQERRPFRITYISTPLDGGFYGLWRWYDELLKRTDPDAYFVVGLNDEMYFLEKGWDQRLRQYVGLYPDHIYRLRTSMHRERNIYDYWEAGCANDYTPFMTRKWLELGGGWCPCNGPDSFQNVVAFYFGWLYRHDTFGRPYRERVVHDLRLGSEGANLGVDDPAALRRRMRGGVIAWFRLMSPSMQIEAARRAQRLHAHIWLARHADPAFEVRDDRKRMRIVIVDAANGNVVWQGNYRLSRLRIFLTNNCRKLNYPYYGGAGALYRGRVWRNFGYYLLLRHKGLDDLNAGRTAARDDAANGTRAGGISHAKTRSAAFRVAYAGFWPLYRLRSRRNVGS